MTHQEHPIPAYDFGGNIYPVEGDEFFIDPGVTITIVPEARIEFYSLKTGRNLGSLIGKGIRLVGTDEANALVYRVVSVTYEENKETEA